MAHYKMREKIVEIGNVIVNKKNFMLLKNVLL